MNEETAFRKWKDNLEDGVFILEETKQPTVAPPNVGAAEVVPGPSGRPVQKRKGRKRSLAARLRRKNKYKKKQHMQRKCKAPPQVAMSLYEQYQACPDILWV